ncbi:hypothetical protein BHE74_00049149 [Ensete ventricosum]|nr:hypothetical protein BHE74_00049149 [Ensete ventricosum]
MLLDPTVDVSTRKMSATLGTDPTVDSPFIVRLRFDDSPPVSPVARLSKHSRVQRKGVSVILTSCGRPVKLRPRFRTRATRSRAGDGARDPHVPVAAPRPTGFLFEDVEFPQAFEPNRDFLNSVEDSVKMSYLAADLALGDDCNIMELSQDHRPIHAAERLRVEASGGYIDDGYLNGVLSVTRALGDWDIKTSRDSPSPLIAEPEFKRVMLTEDDEFLIIACDGIWDVMSSQHAVGIVRRGLGRHDNPEQCARELVLEALRLKTFDNLTVIVVCFSDESRASSPNLKFGCRKSLSVDALCNLKSWLDKDGYN